MRILPFVLLVGVSLILLMILVGSISALWMENIVGDISTNEISEENEYSFYGGDNSNTISKFNFGEVEYECLGSCHCEFLERRSSVVISRGMSYLLVSISTFVALETAQEYFQSKCQEEFSQECDQSSFVKSSVESCTPVIETDEKTKDTFREDRKYGEKRVYTCFGNCSPNLLGTRKASNRKESSRTYLEDIDCGKLKQEGEITVYESDLIHKSPKTSDALKYILTARSLFTKSRLIQFCRKNSRVDYLYKFDVINKETGKVYPKVQKKRGFACVGKSNFQGGKKNNYKNVKCRQIEPKPSAANRDYWKSKFIERKQDWDNGEALG